MRIQELLKLLSQTGRLNFFILAPDELGLLRLLPKALEKVAALEDILYYDAEHITKDRAREIEKEARSAPRAGSELQIMYIYSLQKLSGESVGPLLKAVEDAKYTRFIFQAQSTPRKIHTLMSRSSVVRVPFLSKDVILANVKRLHLDAKAAEELNLTDGTLEGTIRNLSMKDSITLIRRELSKGQRGVAAVFAQDVVESLAFMPAIDDLLSKRERAFLAANSSLERKKLVAYLVMARK